MAASNRIRFACLGLLLAAGPAVAGVRVTEPWSPQAPERTGFEVGLSSSLSTPTGRSREEFDPSPHVSLVATWMQSEHEGIGIDVGYSKWPAPAAGAELDRLLTVLGRGTIRGTEITSSALRIGAHLEFAPLPRMRIAPRVEGGTGMNRVTTRFEIPQEQLIAAGWSGKSNGKGVDWQPDVTACFGLDVRTSAHVKIGFEASYQWMFVENAPSAFTTFSLGGRVTFGRWSS